MNLSNPNLTEVVDASAFDRKLLLDTQLNLGLTILF